MLAKDITKAVSLKQCQSCDAALLDRDKFCRRCGLRQSNRVQPSTSLIKKANGADFETKPMPLAGSGTLRGSYSQPLISSLTHELSSRTSSLRANRRMMRLVSALVTVPLWLMIILLSPLDAYVAAKSIAKQV